MAGEPTVKRMKAVIKDPQHCKRLVLSLQNLNTASSFTDLCFVCAKGQKVYAHKLLLCTVSDQLKQMFLELPDCLQTIMIHLPDVEARMLNLMCDFLYEGHVRVNKNEYSGFQELMNLLGIVLTDKDSPPSRENTQPLQPVQPAPPQPPPQQTQPAQLFYLPTAANSQGQMQYMLATQAPMAQGQMIQGPLVQGVMAPQPATQPVLMAQPGGQLVQAAAPVVASQVQQMVQQNNTQVVPMSGNQMVQCSSQMMIQGNQQPMMSNSQMQVGISNEVAQSSYLSNQPTQQQRPQYVMSSNTNQLTTTSRGALYNQQQRRGVTRGKPMQPQQQNSRITSVRARRLMRAPLPMTQNRSPANSQRMVQRSRHSVQ